MVPVLVIVQINTSYQTLHLFTIILVTRAMQWFCLTLFVLHSFSKSQNYVII